MGLQLFGYHKRPHDIGVTKSNLPIQDCVFLLDFSRPLGKLRLFGIVNRWLGPTICLSVPVVHLSEDIGGYVISVQHNEPYFVDLQKLWSENRGYVRTSSMPPIDGLEMIADFGTHFSEDC